MFLKITLKSAIKIIWSSNLPYPLNMPNKKLFYSTKQNKRKQTTNYFSAVCFGAIFCAIKIVLDGHADNSFG